MNLLSVALSLVQGEAEHVGPSSPFEVEFGLFFWTWAVFIAFFFILKKYAYPAIVSATAERERTIARHLDEAAKMNAEAQAALEEHRRLLAGAKEEAVQLITDAKGMADRERVALLAKAKTEQEQLIARASREIEAERDRAVAELRREAVDLSLAVASRLLDRNLDDAANRKIVTAFLESTGNKN